MSLGRTLHLEGSTLTGDVKSGVHYYSHSFPAKHRKCWMEVAVYDKFPSMPSLYASQIQEESSYRKTQNAQFFGLDNKNSHNKVVNSKRDEEMSGTKENGAMSSCNTTADGEILEQECVYNITNENNSEENIECCLCERIQLEIELYNDVAPLTCENFERLCDGVILTTQSQNLLPLVAHSKFDAYSINNDEPHAVLLSYKGTHFHKIIPHFIIQGGDVTLNRCKPHTCRNYLNSYGRGWFDDESKQLRFNEAGLLGMANNGPNSNGVQFFITTSHNQERALNGRHVCFGKVVTGLQELLQEVQRAGDVNGTPTRYVVITDCGSGPLPQRVEPQQEEEQE